MPGADFQKAVKESAQLTEKPSQDELLKLYALFKQAQEDFTKASKPGTFDFKGKYKYSAWEKLVNEGVTPEQAEKDYVTLVNELKDKYGFDANKVPEKVGN